MKSTAPLPEKIKIGYRDYTVERWHSMDANSARLYGEASHSPAILRVDTSYGSVHSGATLLHEVLHGIWTMYGLPEGEKEFSQETIVERLSNALACMARDNPGLLTQLDQMFQGTQPSDMR